MTGIPGVAGYQTEAGEVVTAPTMIRRIVPVRRGFPGMKSNRTEAMLLISRNSETSRSLAILRRDKLEGTMHYPRILALIDAELDRLHRARLLLASSLGSPERATKKKTSSGGRPPRREITKAKQIAPSPKETEEPVLPIEVIPRKRTRQVPRRSRAATRTLTAAPFVSPLAGVVPSGPVFVSARQVQELHSARQTNQAPEHGDPSATDNLTPERLRQKWLHGSAS